MNTPIFPPALEKGDTIGVFAPSSTVEREDIEKSKELLESKGYKVFIHPQTFEKLNQSAGNALQKTLAFQGLWQRKDIKALWAAGGGNRCLHLLESINFKKLPTTPKILIGFSDVTALLNAVNAHTGITTIHGPVFKSLHKYNQLPDLLKLLAGEQDLALPLDKARIIHHGRAEGKLIGGNLSIFQYLPQTLPEEFWKDSILFLEDCNEEPSKLDRMLLHLKRVGVLKNIKALALGEFSGQKETGRPYGFTLEDIVQEHTEGLKIPVLMNLPFGHGKTFYPLPIGTNAKIDTQKSIFKTTEPATQK
ncbi:MAG: LD-carboxypeptidase [Alphaproteobacteria bacterium]|nr:LD-carboxypeptidase [Alphaproteobacteria bacterium]